MTASPRRRLSLLSPATIVASAAALVALSSWLWSPTLGSGAPAGRRFLVDKDAAWSADAGTTGRAGLRILADYGKFVLAEMDGPEPVRRLRDRGLRVRREMRPEVRLRRRMVTSADHAAATRGEDLYVVRFPGPALPQWVEALDGIPGLRLLAALPEGAYIAWLPAGADPALAGLPVPPDMVAPLLPADRMSPELDGLSEPAPVALYFMDSPRGRIALRQARESSLHPPRPAPRMPGVVGEVLVLDPPDLKAAATRRVMVWAEPWEAASSHDEVSSLLTAGQLQEGIPLGPQYRQWLASLNLSDLSGHTVQVVDTGIDSGLTGREHPSLAGRVVAAFNETGESEAGDCAGHGTHIAGIIAGDPPVAHDLSDEDGYSYGLGIAPGVRLVSSRIFNCSGDLVTVRPFSQILSDAWDQGARVSNNSWGRGGPSYTALSREFDAMVRDVDLDPNDGAQPMVIVASMGNAGPLPYTLTSPAVSKNVISVGGTESVRPEATDGCGTGPGEADNGDSIRIGGSRGPTVDGRMKPDLVAPGSHIVSAVSQSKAYEGFGLCDTFFPPGQHLYSWTSGTSQSAAHVSGASVLFMEDYRRQFGALPSPAMVKAALVATAFDIVTDDIFEDAVLNRPNINQGWGRADLSRLLGERRRAAYDQVRVFTAPGQEASFGPLMVADPSRPVTVSLAWTDAPGTPAASSWVNDLDLEVETLQQRYLGNAFDEGFSEPGGEPDGKNNLEVVALRAGTTDTVTIRVTAVSLPGDGLPSHPGRTDQDFALYVENVLMPGPAGILLPDRAESACDGNAALTLTDRGLSGAGRAFIQASSGSEPGPEAVELLELSPPSGIFRGAVQLSEGPPLADGILQVGDGETVTLSYLDMDLGDGSPGLVEANVVARCSDLSIGDLQVTGIGEHSAAVTWTTSRPSDSRVTGNSGIDVRDPALVTAHRVILRDLTSCTVHRIQVESTDTAGFSATSPAGSALPFGTGTGRKVLLFTDDIESLQADWTHGGDDDEWELGIPQSGPPSAVSGERVWGTDLDGSYEPGSDSWLALPPVDLRGLRSASLTFRHYVDIPAAVTAGDPQDGGWVEASVNGGSTWITLSPVGGYPAPPGPGNPYVPSRAGVYAGVNGVWQEARFDLSKLRAGTVHLRFRLWRDPASTVNPGAGWYIDDVALEGIYPCGKGTLTLDATGYGCTSEVEVTLADLDVDLDPLRIGLAPVVAISPQGPLSVQLRETDVDSGVYTGQFSLDNTFQLGRLQVAEGDSILIRYLDKDDGELQPATVEVTSTVQDCAPPAPPTALVVEQAGSGRLRLEWIGPPAPDLAEIRVHYDSDGPGPTYNGVGAAEGASPLRSEPEINSTFLTGLTDCTPHFISLTAVDRFGNESGYSQEAVGVFFTGTPCPRATMVLGGSPGAGCTQSVPLRIDDGNADPDGSSPGSINVAVTSPSAPGPLNVTLLETGPDTGAFTGEIPLGPAPAPGFLEVQEGDTIQVTYVDADTGISLAEVMTLSLPVDDCTPPVVTDLARTRLEPDVVHLQWKTDEPATTVVDFGLDSRLESSMQGPPGATDHSVDLPSIPPCTTVLYRLTASDQRENVTVVDDQGTPLHLESARTLEKFNDDLESGAPGWIAGGAGNEWELGVPLVGPPPPPFGGTVWGTDLDGSYDVGADLVLTTPEIDLTGLTHASLTFNHWYWIFSSTPGGGFDDGAWVEVSTDGGATWTYTEPDGGYPDRISSNLYLITGTPAYAGKLASWQTASFPLDSFTGTRIRIRFHLVQDIFDPPSLRPGWYIDDVAVTASAACHQGAVHIEPGTGSCGQSTMELRVWDLDGDLQPGMTDTVTARVTSPSDPLPLDVTLTETGPSTGEFLGLLPFGLSAAPGILAVTGGDLITAAYSDPDDGTGNSSVALATALVGDCSPPAITGVRWDRLPGDSIRVFWETDEPATSVIRADGGATVVSSPGLTTQHSLVLAGLVTCAPRIFEVAGSDAGGNESIDDNGGSGYVIEGDRTITILYEGFESGAADWRHGGDPDEWEIGSPLVGPGAPFAGTSVAGTRLAGPYTKDSLRQGHDSWLLSPWFSLQGLSSAKLSFQHFHDFAEDTRGDGAVVEILDGGSWRPLTPGSGYPGDLRTDRAGGTRGGFVESSGGWVEERFDLSPFIGRSVRIRFRLLLDHGTPDTRDGWFLDEILVDGTAACSRGLLQLDREETGCGPGFLDVLLSDADLNQNGSAVETVTLTAVSGSGSLPVSLTETGTATGLFEGTLPISPTTAPGTLTVAEGDLISVSYQDADTGSGGPATVTTSSLASDCTAPGLQGARVEHPGGGTTIALRWETTEPSTTEAVLTVQGMAPRRLVKLGLVTTHSAVFHGLPDCAPYSIQIFSRDAAGNLGTAGGALPPFTGEARSFVPIMADDMEGLGTNWVSSGTANEWERGEPLVGPPGPFQGSRVSATDLDGLYDGGADAFLRTPFVDLRSVSSATLSFWHYYSVFASGTPNADDDAAWVEIHLPGSSFAVYVRPEDGYNNTIDRDASPPIQGGSGVFAGNSESWQLSTVDLSPFAGRVIQVQFHIWNDIVEGVFNRTTGAGWYIDDLRVTAPGACHPSPVITGVTTGSLIQGTTGTELKLAGAGFRQSMTLDAGPGIALSLVTVESPVSATALADLADDVATGPRTLRATNPDGQWAERAGALVVLANPSRADIDGSGVVDGRDLALLAAAFATFSGESAYNPAADLDGDGTVDGGDLAILAAGFGAVLTP